MAFPEPIWPEIIAGVIARTHAADKFRKRLGKYHPKWGMEHLRRASVKTMCQRLSLTQP